MVNERVSSRTKPLTRLELFKLQMNNVTDYLRAENSGKDYLPAQLGGTYGQRELLTDNNVLDVTEIST